MSQTDPYSLTHYGILGMHWGVRKAESYKKEATGYVKKAAKAKRDAAQSRLEALGYQRQITSGHVNSPTTSTTRDAQGKVVTTTTNESKSAAESRQEMLDQAEYQKEWASRYETRAALAFKRAKGQKLTTQDLVTKKELYSEGMHRAIGAGLMSVGFGIGGVLAGVNGGGPLFGLASTGMGAYAIGEAIKTSYRNQ